MVGTHEDELPNRVRGIGQRVVYRLREDTANSFDRDHVDLCAAFAFDVGEVMRRMALITAVSERLKPGPYFESLSLLSKALDSAVSAFHLIRQRAYLETGALLRVTLELAAVAIHISHDPVAFDAYCRTGDRQLEPTKSVTFAKRYIPCLGEMIGALSRVAVHTTALAHGSEITRSGELRLIIGERQGTVARDRRTLLLLLLFTAIIQRTLEITQCEPATIGFHVPGRPDVRFAGAGGLVEERLSVFLESSHEGQQEHGTA